MRLKCYPDTTFVAGRLDTLSVLLLATAKPFSLCGAVLSKSELAKEMDTSNVVHVK